MPTLLIQFVSQVTHRNDNGLFWLFEGGTKWIALTEEFL